MQANYNHRTQHFTYHLCILLYPWAFITKNKTDNEPTEKYNLVPTNCYHVERKTTERSCQWAFTSRQCLVKYIRKNLHFVCTSCEKTINSNYVNESCLINFTQRYCFCYKYQYKYILFRKKNVAKLLSIMLKLRCSVFKFTHYYRKAYKMLMKSLEVFCWQS